MKKYHTGKLKYGSVSALMIDSNPVMTTLVFTLFYHLGLLTGDPNRGLFLYNLLQSAFLAVLFSVIATLIYHVFSFLFSNGDEADYQGARQKEEMNELRELEEKYKDVSHADLLRAFDASRRFQTGQVYSADRTRNY